MKFLILKCTYLDWFYAGDEALEDEENDQSDEGNEPTGTI